MEHVKQPKGSNLCGQACVAILAGVNLQRGIDLVGHSRRTRTSDIKRALEKSGIKCGNRLIPITYPLKSHTGIFFLKHPKTKNRHWVACHNEFYFDPGADKEGDFSMRHKGWYEASYLPIYLEA